MRHLFLALLCGPLAAQSPLQLPAVADTTAYSDRPTNNFGSALELGLSKAPDMAGVTYFMRSFLRFDLTALAGLPPATKAEVRVFEVRTQGAGGLEVAAYQVSQPWIENTLTWNNMPGNAGTVLSRVKVGDNFNRGWKSFDITPLVRAWQSGTTNNGVVIRLERESTAGARRPAWVASREAGTASQRPYLYVETRPFTSFGQGCGPVATWPRLTVSSGTPKVGTTMQVQGSLLAPGKAAYVAAGLSNSSYLGVPLPIMLNPNLGPPCQLLVSLEVLTTAPTNSSGICTLTLPIPVLPGLAGSQVFMQMASPGSLPYMTEGLAIRFY